MADYTKTTDFAAKDTLPGGDTNKVIRGSEFEQNLMLYRLRLLRSLIQQVLLLPEQLPSLLLILTAVTLMAQR